MSAGEPLRMTRSRKAILEVLSATRCHPTADEVYELVRERMPRVSLGTVYRNLDVLAREGMIRTLATAGEQRRYDGITEHHHHIQCRVCGRVDDVDFRPAESLESGVRDRRGYDVRGYRLCFVGVCEECAKRESCSE